MSGVKIVGQQYEIYDFSQARIRSLVPKKGEQVFVKNTPTQGEVIVQLIGDGEKKIEELIQYSYMTKEAVDTAIEKHNNYIASHNIILDTIEESDTPPVEEVPSSIKSLFQRVFGNIKKIFNLINTETKCRIKVIEDEVTARKDGDEETLAAAIEYSNKVQLATQTWSKSVKSKNELPEIDSLTESINYLCRVIADENPENNGVWQRIAFTDEWTYFSDNQDWIDENELDTAINKAVNEINLIAENGAGTDTTTPSISDLSLSSALQTIWAKIRQIGNKVEQGGGEDGNSVSGESIISYAEYDDLASRNLLEVLQVSTIQEAMQELYARRNLPAGKRFDGLLLGDYIDGLSLNLLGSGLNLGAWNDTYKNNRLEILAFNPYKGVGAINAEITKDHIMFGFRNAIATYRMNATAINTDGFVGSELFNTLTNVLVPILETRLEVSLMPVSLQRSKKTSHSWETYKIWLPSEPEICGFQTIGDELNRENTNLHIPLLQKSYHKRIKKWNGSRYIYWTSTPMNSGGSSFVVINSAGNITYGNANTNSIGISPVFCIAIE